MAVNINIPSQVSQTITDGVTDKAPSENTVHDALALKANSADLGTTAFSNDYNDLNNLPSIPAAQVNSDWNAVSGVAEILNKPTIPTSLPPSGAAGGDLNGNYPNPTVDGIHGIDMQSGTPTSGDVWVYGGAPAKWQHQMLHATQVDNDSAVTGTHVSDALNHLDTTKEPSITAGTTAQYWRGDKSWQTLNKSAVGLGNVDNTSDLNKPISTATQTALNAKQDTLVSGTNIKTVNSNSLLGSGNVAVQDVLVSGTNIKTVNGNSLLGSGDITVGGGITVGTTAVTSGTIGRVFFQGTGNVVQQDSDLFWDNTNKRLGIGKSPAATSAKTVIAITDGTANQNYYLTLRNLAAGFGSWGFAKSGSNDLAITYETNTDAPALGTSLRFYYGGTSAFASSLSVGTLTSPSARLDVRAQGALSTDIAFRVRNSADTANFLELTGAGTFRLGGTTSLENGFSYLADGRLFMAKSGGNFIELNPSPTNNRIYGGTSGWEISTTSSTKVIELRTANTALQVYGGSVQLAAGLNAADGTNIFSITNGTAPTGNYTDSFKLYSADIVAGNAAPHFRTENGNIIKLFRGAALTAADGTLANAVTRIAELEARLQAHGLIA